MCFSGCYNCNYINERLDWRRREDLECDDLECIWIEVFIKGLKNLLLCVMYRPPDSSLYQPINFKTLLHMQLKTAIKSNNEIIIMGDLNINYLDKTNHANIKTLLTLWGLTQTITQPT